MDFDNAKVAKYFSFKKYLHSNACNSIPCRMNPFRTHWNIIQLDHVYHIEVDDIENLHTFIAASCCQIGSIRISRKCNDWDWTENCFFFLMKCSMHI